MYFIIQFYYLSIAEPVEVDLCSTNPCGSNAQCNNGICTCLPEFYGDAYVGCRPECVLSSDCPRDKTCVRNKCKNPCPEPCAFNAICTVVNHVPMCTCPNGFEGNAFLQCSPLRGNLSFLFFFILTTVSSINLYF